MAESRDKSQPSDTDASHNPLAKLKLGDSVDVFSLAQTIKREGSGPGRAYEGREGKSE